MMSSFHLLPISETVVATGHSGRISALDLMLYTSKSSKMNVTVEFEKLTREHENITLIRLSRSKAMVPASLGDRAVGINADMAQSIEDIAKILL